MLSDKMAQPPAKLARSNSMIRGSGHSMHGLQAKQNSILRRSTAGGSALTVPLAVYDLILLHSVSEDAVCKNLVEMYNADMIYTYIGNVVVSVNPFRELPIYSQETIDKYRGRSAFDPKLAPHIFALADTVFNDMKYRGRDQVVIISGESGAGKTEASKKIMQYVAAVSSSSEKVNQVKNKLLHTNPVLEAFGNAKTLRNDNSSRFGKYMDLQFDFHGEPAGGFITTYLLEKARVVRQMEGERNFHIFYQMLAGGEAKKLGLSSDPKHYHYLKQGSAETVKGMNDAEWYKEMTQGLAAVGFAAQDKRAMFEVLGAILLLGQVSFKAHGNGAAADALPPQLATLLGVAAEKIGPALVHNTVVVNRQPVASQLSAAQALAARDTLAKAMYDRLFAWVYSRLNSFIAADKNTFKAVIGVLDIYGFEILQTNSFEQFCINYCNEKLQQLFIELTLKQEQDEYRAEGIQWTPVDFFNNKIICDLVEGRPVGIVAMLDEESIRPGDKSDAVWLDKMAAALGSHKHFKTRSGPADRSLPEGTFKLVHYAGEVLYTVGGFLDKNTDTLFKDLSRLMFTCKNPILHEMFPEGDESTWVGAAKRPPTAGKAFVASMQAMIEVLNTKVPSYVRCIKPNHRKVPKRIEEDLLRHQVQYLGLVENVRVRRAGFCFRELIEDFFWRYKLLSPNTYPRWRGSARDGAETVLRDLGIAPTSYQMGKTKLFIKSPNTVFRLEEERDDKIDVIVRRLQMAYRLYRIRKEIREYYTQLQTKFANVKKDPHLGYRVVWPKHGPILDEADKFLKRVFKNWWARKKILGLPEERRGLMRVQLLAHQFLGGKKAGFAIRAKFDSMLLTHPNLTAFAGPHGGAAFACDAWKISRKGAPHRRFVIVTRTFLFRTDEKFKINNNRSIALKSISGISVSKYKDSLVVVHNQQPGHDSVFIIAAEADAVPQFVAQLYVACRDAGNKIPVNVLDAVQYNNTRKPGANKTASFRENPSGVAGTVWRSGGVLYA